MIGTVIDGKYRIEDVIGEGGMSSIYRADHLGLNRLVAIKVLHPALAEDPEAIARLRHEAKVVATIGHANICEVFDLGRTHSGSPYLVMELLVGQSLAERLKSSGAMHFMQLAPLVKQVLAALQSAHDKGILHRDLKPENVFVEESRHRSQPNAKLLDFGISKSMSYGFQEEQRLTHTGMVMGTPYYMAPEQARGDSGLDQRVDLWAVGVMMYEALTGRRPFVATNYNALLVKILTSRPRPAQKLVPTIPNVAADIIDRALSKLREDRFQSAREFTDAITHAQRVCVVENPAEATMFYRRPEQSRPRRSRGSRSRQGWEIEDPSTFIDDDFDYDPSQIPGPLREYQPPAPPEYPSYDDFESEPAEPTLRERIRPAAVPQDPQPPATPQPHDTDVLHRPIRDRLATAPDSLRDTDVMKRAPMFSEAEKTEVLAPEMFTDAEKTEVVVRSRYETGETPSYDDRPTAPMPPPVPPPSPSHTKTDPLRRPERPSARKSEAPRKRSSQGPPRVPRPKPKPDDEEKTTLFNPARARALRAEASEPEPESQSGNNDE
jgi:serine/threonine-protein kinase